MDEKRLSQIVRRTNTLRVLSKMGTGSKTNDSVIGDSVRDLEVLIEFTYNVLIRGCTKASQSIITLNLKDLSINDPSQLKLF